MHWRRCLFALSFAELLRTVRNNSARESVNSVHIETRPSSEASAIRDHLIFAGLIGACVPGPKWCRGPRARQCPLALCAPWERRSMGVSPCCGNHRSGRNAARLSARGMSLRATCASAAGWLARTCTGTTAQAGGGCGTSTGGTCPALWLQSGALRLVEAVAQALRYQGHRGVAVKHRQTTKPIKGHCRPNHSDILTHKDSAGRS